MDIRFLNMVFSMKITPHMGVCGEHGKRLTCFYRISAKQNNFRKNTLESRNNKTIFMFASPLDNICGRPQLLMLIDVSSIRYYTISYIENQCSVIKNN